jgi:SAM-dependent methyltransferase
MKEVNFLQNLHTSTKRDYLARMNAEKPECMRKAKEWGFNYWDGDRRFGYGGYHRDKRWKPIAEAMNKHYNITTDQSVFDIGCGKGFLLDEFRWILGDHNACGCDISEYALRQPRDGYSLYDMSSCTKINYGTANFHFTYSINVFHNLNYRDLKQAIKEMVRITKPDGNSYICVESYRNEEELTNLQAWQLTCLSYYSPDDWKCILEENGYNGDVEFIFFT